MSSFLLSENTARMMAFPNVTGTKRAAESPGDSDDDDDDRRLRAPGARTTDQMKTAGGDRTPTPEQGLEELMDKVPEHWQQDMTLAFPSKLPMEYEYGKPKFYVRQCYYTYYEEVIRLLANNNKVVTVSGTPGIGKSIFFAFFLLRYSQKHPTTTVVTASFTKDRDMTEVVVWKGGKFQHSADDDEPDMRDAIKKAKQAAKGDIIYLYDGPPKKAPKHIQMVCFTSPNERWFSLNEKSEFRVNVYMPMWDLEELRTAASVLDLKVVDPKKPGEEVFVADEVDERFRIFGGVARECLTTNITFLDERRRKLESDRKVSY